MSQNNEGLVMELEALLHDEKLKGLFSKAMELLRQFDSYRTNLYYRDQ